MNIDNKTCYKNSYFINKQRIIVFNPDACSINRCDNPKCQLISKQSHDLDKNPKTITGKCK